MGNRDEIIRFLRILFAAGDVFEVRVLNAVTANYQHPHAESGYFDYEHIPKAADAILALRSYTGAYATLNPVMPALLARANNRLAPAKRDNSTTDDEILCRRWLPIDCDPVRPSGISSDDGEHEAAHALAKEIRDGLSSLGWPEPIVLDSGNGAQMLYRVDLPADDGNLVQNALEEIAKASTDKVKVDLSVFNASRIWRIPGTVNRKGDPLPDRPHRQARIVRLPKRIAILDEEHIRAVLMNTSAPVATATSPPGTPEAFDADRWVMQFCPELGKAVPWKGGRKWVFKVCPFNPDHDNSSAVLIQESSGAMAFRCHHNGCAGNDWRKLRELREPGCYDRPEAEPLPLDWGALGAKAKSEGLVINTIPPEQPAKPSPAVENTSAPDSDSPPEFTDPGKIPQRLLHIPGFIDEYVEWTMSGAPYPNRVLSFCGALAFLSYITGRKVISDRNTLPNIYLIALADPGTGKDHPRKANVAAAIAANAGAGVVDDFTSGGAIEDLMFIQPSVLFQKDEIDTMFNVIKMAKDANAEGLLGKLLTIYSSSNSSIQLRQKAMARADVFKMRNDKRQGNATPLPIVNNPYLVIFGTAVPEFFCQSLSQRVLGNGMGARCILLEAGQRGAPNRSKRLDMPDGIKRSMEVIASYTGGGPSNLSDLAPNMLEIHATPGADALLDEMAVRYDGIYHEYDRQHAHVPKAFWGRAYEKVLKLAILYAVSANVTSPVVTEDAVRWADEFVTYTTRQTLFLVSTYSFENPFDEKRQKLIRYLRENHGSYSHSALLKRSHESKELFDKLIETMTEAGEIDVEWRDGKGQKKIKTYRLCRE